MTNVTILLIQLQIIEVWLHIENSSRNTILNLNNIKYFNIKVYSVHVWGHLREESLGVQISMFIWLC